MSETFIWILNRPYWHYLYYAFHFFFFFNSPTGLVWQTALTSPEPDMSAIQRTTGSMDNTLMNWLKINKFSNLFLFLQYNLETIRSLNEESCIKLCGSSEGFRLFYLLQLKSVHLRYFLKKQDSIIWSKFFFVLVPSSRFTVEPEMTYLK